MQSGVTPAAPLIPVVPGMWATVGQSESRDPFGGGDGHDHVIPLGPIPGISTRTGTVHSGASERTRRSLHAPAARQRWLGSLG